MGPSDSTAIRTNSPCDESPASLITVRCCQLGCSACLARRSLQIRICSCARHRHIPYERPARAPRNQRQPIRAFSVWQTKTLWFLGHRDAGWGKRSCYNIIEMVVSYSFVWYSFTDTWCYFVCSRVFNVCPLRMCSCNRQHCRHPAHVFSCG